MADQENTTAFGRDTSRRQEEVAQARLTRANIALLGDLPLRHLKDPGDPKVAERAWLAARRVADVLRDNNIIGNGQAVAIRAVSANTVIGRPDRLHDTASLVQGAIKAANYNATTVVDPEDSIRFGLNPDQGYRALGTAVAELEEQVPYLGLQQESPRLSVVGIVNSGFVWRAFNKRRFHYADILNERRTAKGIMLKVGNKMHDNFWEPILPHPSRYEESAWSTQREIPPRPAPSERTGQIVYDGVR